MNNAGMLEELREIFADNRTHITLGEIQKLELSADRSVLRAQVLILPEARQVVAKVAWDATGPDAGTFTFPNQGDWVLLACAEGSPNDIFVIKRLTSKSDTIPTQAVTGDAVYRALAGKKAHLLSDTRINLGRGGSEPTENVVLGQVFKEMMSEFLQIFAEHKHIGNLGYYTPPPDNFNEALTLKSSPVDDEAILSDVSFTEK